MGSRLKLGELYFIKDEWKLSLGCSDCSSELDDLSSFVVHALAHSFPVESLESISKLVGQLNGNLDEVDEGEEESAQEKIIQVSIEDLLHPIGAETQGNETERVEEVMVEDEYESVEYIEDVGDSGINESLSREETKDPEVMGHKADPDFIKTDRGYECQLCHKTFDKRSHCVRHMRIHTGEHPYRCEVCGCTFTDSSNFKVHLNRHLGIKPYPCTLCPKTFTTSTELKIHIRSHTGERPYVCAECGSSFTVSAHLLTHKRSHLNERRYQCATCGKAFLTSKKLKNHEYCHSEERRFKCELCPKSFKAPAAYRSHQQVHATEKKFECRICGTKFQQYMTMYSHMRSHDKPAKKRKPKEIG